MIPKYLKLKGLYSYQKEQEIHFDALTDASLFGIFGAVGSGKSSILEAITFALYGDTERLNRSGDDRTYNMMNLKSSELSIDFECIAGKEGAKYKFTVKGKRNSKNFKEVKTFERKGYIWADEAWIPLDESQNAEQIVGLSYDNFRRTIIIPQGKFQEFIELKDGQRTLMMKELFHLEKYDLSRNVGSLSKQNDLEIASVDGQLLGLGDVTPEMIESLEIQQKHLLLEISNLQKKHQLHTESELKYQKLKVLFEKVSALEIQKKHLESQRPEIDLREQSLRTFEICSIHFKSHLENKKSITSANNTHQNTFDLNQQKIKGLDLSLKTLTTTLAEARLKYDTREILLQNARELAYICSILEQQTRFLDLQNALVRGEEKLHARTLQLADLKQERVLKQGLLEDKKEKLADVNELSQVKSWFMLRDEYNLNRDSVKAEAAKLKSELDLCIAHRSIQIQEMNEKFNLSIDSTNSIDEVNSIIQAYLAKHEIKREEITKEAVKINTQLELLSYAKNLKNGEACPLCGSEHHPGVQHQDSKNSDKLDLLAQKRSKLTQLDQEIRQYGVTIGKAFDQATYFEKQKDSIRARFDEAKTKLLAHQQLFSWSQFDVNNKEAFDKYFNEVTLIQQSIKDDEALIKKMSDQYDVFLVDTQEKVEKPIQKIKNDILEINSRIETWKSQLTVVQFSLYEGRDVALIKEEIEKNNRDFEKITLDYELVLKQIEQCEKERNTILGSQETLQVALKNGEQGLLAVQNRLDTELQLHQFESEEIVQDILKLNIDITQEKKFINDYQVLFNNTSRDLESLLVESAGEVYQLEIHKQVQVELEALTHKLNVNKKEEGRVDGLLKKMREDLSQKAVLLQKKEQRLVRKEHLDDLAKLFRSSGFVDYASSIYLQNLIEAANQRFHQMTHQRLHLELGEGNSFWVRDLLNGGHMRLLKTLSGGQKFQAALSLALALADHIHVKNKSVHNFFFLDEGFGSLDKHALATVFETLKSLRKENRIVGIISHVEDLQQEIQTYLTIEETEEGSVISESWK